MASPDNRKINKGLRDLQRGCESVKVALPIATLGSTASVGNISADNVEYFISMLENNVILEKAILKSADSLLKIAELLSSSTGVIRDEISSYNAKLKEVSQ